jgi:hypothetical protein
MCHLDKFGAYGQVLTLVYMSVADKEHSHTGEVQIASRAIVPIPRRKRRRTNGSPTETKSRRRSMGRDETKALGFVLGAMKRVWQAAT